MNDSKGNKLVEMNKSNNKSKNKNTNDTNLSYKNTYHILSLELEQSKNTEDDLYDNDENKFNKSTQKNQNKYKKNKPKNTTLIKSDIDKSIYDKEIKILQTDTTQISNLSEYKFTSQWNVWIHSIEDITFWKPESYSKIFTIESFESFQKFFSNLEELDMNKFTFFIMRDKCQPWWEDDSNKNGGTCSIRVYKDRIIDIIEQIGILILNESFSDNIFDINGLSFNTKLNWGIIKIWNKDKNLDTSIYIPPYINKKYGATYRYIQNKPEWN